MELKWKFTVDSRSQSVKGAIGVGLAGDVADEALWITDASLEGNFKGTCVPGSRSVSKFLWMN